jgi:hypothetical protein
MSEFHYSVIPAAKTSTDKDRLWSFHGVDRHPGPAGTAVLHKRRSDYRCIVQANVADALALCGPYRTTAAHTRHVISEFSELAQHAAHTEKTLLGLAEAGLFESSEATWQRLTETHSDSAPIASCRLFILTCDRPSALERLLRNLVDKTMPNEIESVWVIDDSRQLDNQSSNARIIETLASACPLPITHFGATQRTHLIENLKAAVSGSESTVDWLLSAASWGEFPTYGVARNLALLLSVGKRALVLDDDIMLDAITPPLSPKTLRMGHANEREAVFYPSQEALNQHALPSQESPLALMSSSLGHPLAALLPKHFANDRGLAGANGHLMDHLTGQSVARITQCGSWGDPGTANANWIFHLPENALKKLLETGDSLASTLSARASWLGYRGPVISQYGTLSQLTGLDHTVLLPPYLPAGRGEDFLFGILLQRVHPESAVWNEGWAIRHQPLENRADRSALSGIGASPSLSLFIDWLGREPAGQEGLSPAWRLNGIADQVRQLTEMNLASLESLVRQGLISKRSDLLTRCMEKIARLDNLPDQTGKAEWQHFLEATRDKLVSEITQSEAAPLTEALTQGALGDIGALRHHGEQFADALCIWPQLCDVAAGL